MINVTPPTSFVSLPQSLPPQPSDQPFDKLLGTVAPPVPTVAVAPAPGVPQPAGALAAQAIESGATLLAFLGFNPVKAPQGEAIAKELLPLTDDDDDVVASDLVVPLPAPSVTQYQPIAAAIAAGNQVAAQPGLAPAPEALTQEGRSASPASLRAGVGVALANEQIADATLAPVAQSSIATDISAEPFAAAASAAAIAPGALPVVSASNLASPSAPTRLDIERPEFAQIAVAATLVPPTPIRSAQTAATISDMPEESAANIEILGTSTPASLPTPSVTSLVNGPTSPAAIAQTDPLQTIADRQLDLARDTRWIDELARDIVTASGRSDRLSFNLVPPQLGQLQVDLSHSDQGLTVHMRSDSEATTQIVGAAQPRLVEDLKSQGIRVASTEVSTGGGQSQGQGQHQRDDSQLFEFARQRFEPTDDTESDRPGGRFA